MKAGIKAILLQMGFLDLVWISLSLNKYHSLTHFLLQFKGLCSLACISLARVEYRYITLRLLDFELFNRSLLYTLVGL